MFQKIDTHSFTTFTTISFAYSTPRHAGHISAIREYNSDVSGFNVAFLLLFLFDLVHLSTYIHYRSLFENAPMLGAHR